MKAMRLQLRAGADVIKICGSGGVGSERDNPIDQQFTLAEMKAMVEVATQARRIIGAHCHGKAGIDAALSPAGYAKLEATATAQWNAMQIAIKKGVKVAIGTDTGVSMPNSIATQGLNAKELYYHVTHVKAGMTPLQAIEVATANGPLTLGPQAPKAGQLKEGYDADFIAVDEDPLDDIRVLIGGSHITHVWRQGIAYKWPGHPINII